jgi:Sel1 repeat
MLDFAQAIQHKHGSSLQPNSACESPAGCSSQAVGRARFKTLLKFAEHVERPAKASQVPSPWINGACRLIQKLAATMSSSLGCAYDKLVLGDYAMRLLNLFLVLFMCAIAAPAVAGPPEDASAAHAKGDYATALRLYRLLADKGDLVAQFNLGGMYYEGKGVARDYAAALTWYLKAADQGDALAQTNLGNMYFFGKGTTQDYAAAMHWFRKAADQGNAMGQFDLGGMYYQGLSVPQDYATALSWYLKAAEQGAVRAQSNLGSMYYNGVGVPQDYIQAHKWLNLAALHYSASEKEAHDRTIMALNIVAAKMTPAQITEAQALARDWKPATEH